MRSNENIINKTRKRNVTLFLDLDVGSIYKNRHTTSIGVHLSFKYFLSKRDIIQPSYLTNISNIIINSTVLSSNTVLLMPGIKGIITVIDIMILCIIRIIFPIIPYNE